MDTGNRNFKIITLVFKYLVICSTLTSCYKNNFNVITNNDVAYWRFENSNIFSSYSKKDSLLLYLNEDLTQQRQLIWQAKFGEKFRFSGDTLFRYIRDKDFFYSSDTLIALSLAKNKITLYNPNNPEGGYSTWNRLGKKEVKRRKMLRFRNWHNYRLQTLIVEISLPKYFTEEKGIYENGVAYYIHGLDDGVKMIISEGNTPYDKDKDYMKRENYIPIETKSRKGRRIYFGQLVDYHCRTDSINNISISYIYARDLDKIIYDKVFEDIKCTVIK